MEIQLSMHLCMLDNSSHRSNAHRKVSHTIVTNYDKVNGMVDTTTRSGQLNERV